MRPLIPLLLTIGVLGYVLKDHPTEAELLADPMAAPATTATTTTTEPPATVAPSSTNPVVIRVQVETTVPATLGAEGMGARCAEWWPTAAAMGWPDELLPILDEVMWRESRCIADATNGADHGLVQVNWATWRHMVTDLGYTREHLTNPAINLLIGRLIYQEAINAGYRCPWSPWFMSGDYC